MDGRSHIYIFGYVFVYGVVFASVFVFVVLECEEKMKPGPDEVSR